MNIAIKIACLALFLALHLEMGSGATVAHAIFYASFITLLGLAVIFRQKGSKLRTGRVATALAAAACALLLLQLAIRGNIYGVYHLYIVMASWLLFFVLVIFFSAGRRLKKWCCFAAIASAAFEVALGFGQLFGWAPSGSEHFRLGGAFGNPGAYAGYLAAVSPLMLSLLLAYRRSRKAENLLYCLAVCLAFSVFMLLISRSRGAWLAAGLGCLLVLNDRFSLLRKARYLLRTPARKAAAIAALVTLAPTGAYALYQFKADSALGRLLVWKVSASTPHSSWLWGNGAGYFEAGYGKWQSSYFATHGGTEAERYVADYVTCAYNEFLEVALEHGLIFLLALTGLFVYAFRQKSRAKSSLTSGAAASLAAIVVLMCVSYPLKIMPVYLYLIFCLALLSANAAKGLPWRWPAKLTIAGAGLAVAAAGLLNLYGYHWLRQGQQLVFSGQPEKGVAAYQKALPILKNSGIFRFYYGSALAQAKRYEESVEELKAAIQKSSNPSCYILLGSSYQKLNQRKEAEQAYRTAACMTPGKLYPKYLLAKLYADMEEYGEAEKWAQEILRSKEKVPTTAAKEIKEEMRNLVQSIANLKSSKT
jgi:tetratricopeptide (TPR) repeat protein